MNREIKFRVWNGIKVCKVISIDFNYDFYEDGHSHIHDITNETTFLQYTGLKDKNGVEIYERDIVTSDYGLGNNNLNIDCEIVEWEDFYNYKANGMISENIEVIGNIYENPELLEEIENE